jgi:hypothetical protein
MGGNVWGIARLKGNHHRIGVQGTSKDRKQGEGRGGGGGAIYLFCTLHPIQIRCNLREIILPCISRKGIRTRQVSFNTNCRLGRLLVVVLVAIIERVLHRGHHHVRKAGCEAKVVCVKKERFAGGCCRILPSIPPLYTAKLRESNKMDLPSLASTLRHPFLNSLIPVDFFPSHRYPCLDSNG